MSLTKTLSSQQVRFLRSQGHHLRPVVMIGQKGITENVLKEIDIALEHHELIKITIADLDRVERQAISETVCSQMGAHLVQLIGRISLLYRPAKQPKLVLPK